MNPVEAVLLTLPRPIIPPALRPLPPAPSAHLRRLAGRPAGGEGLVPAAGYLVPAGGRNSFDGHSSSPRGRLAHACI